MAYDAAREEAVLFGGVDSYVGPLNHLGDTWTFGGYALGDLNCDCVQNAFDIEPFVELLTGG